MKGKLLRVLMVLAYLWAFFCALEITANFAYWVALGVHDKLFYAPLALGALTMIYTLIAMITTCCGGGAQLFWILFDFIFLGAMVAVAVMSRQAVSCSTWLTVSMFNHSYVGAVVCALFVGSFGSAIFAGCLFILTIIYHFLIRRRQAREQTALE